MVKKAKETIETVDPADAKEALVSVEMTAAQKERVLKIMSEEPEEAPKVDESLYEVTLNYAHKINGTSYGPGKVTVRAQLTSILMNQDFHQRQNEIGLNVSSDRLFKIMQGGGMVRVK